jgi:nucleoside-diphosphate kinase
MNALTLALIKPDAFRRRLVGEIVTRIEREGFELVAGRMLQPSAGDWMRLRQFYGKDHDGQPYFEPLITFMASGPSLAFILRHRTKDAIATWRVAMGSWKERDITTIRGLLMREGHTLENLVHGSDSEDSFKHEASVLGLLP